MIMMNGRIEKLGWRQYYAYYQLDGWHLLGFYYCKKDAVSALKDLLIKVRDRKNNISNKHNCCRYDFELE